jgi:hypothetical protein
MDLQIKKVWLPGAASCLLFFGFYYVLIWLPFDENRFPFLAIPYLVLPCVGAVAARTSEYSCPDYTPSFFNATSGQPVHSLTNTFP